MKIFILTLMLLFVFSCSSTPPFLRSSNVVPATISQTYLASYDYTWAAALKEMERFSLKVINIDAGIIQTEDIETYDSSYETASERDKHNIRNKIKFNIEVRITALPKSDKYPRTEVTITKYVAKLNDFGEERPINSNLTDEKTILYRIIRLLEIERLKIERKRNL